MTPRQRSILVGAVVTGVLGTSYLSFINTICCLGVMVGGAVAVQQFISRTGASIESGDGAVLGALAGAGGAVFAAVFDRLLRPLNLDRQSISQDLMQNFMAMQEQQMSPEMMQQFQEGGSTTMMILGFAVGLVVNAIFGAIGGAIGVAIFGSDAEGPSSSSESPPPAESAGERTAPEDTQSRRQESGGISGGAQADTQDESSGDAESNRDGSV